MSEKLTRLIEKLRYPMMETNPDGTYAYAVLNVVHTRATMDEAANALTTLRLLSEKMAQDDGLWFRAQTASEAYLQQALRTLCAAIEGEKLTFRAKNPSAPW